MMTTNGLERGRDYAGDLPAGCVLGVLVEDEWSRIDHYMKLQSSFDQQTFLSWYVVLMGKCLKVVSVNLVSVMMLVVHSKM